MSVIHYRLMIEGCPVEWVTGLEYECETSDGRMRYAGLQYDGLRRIEDLAIKDCFTTQGDITVTIRHEKAAEQFAIYPKALTRYTTRIDKVDPPEDVPPDPVTFSVVRTSGIVAGDIIHIATEALLVDSVNSGTKELTAYARYWDTQPQTHYIQSDYDSRSSSTNPTIYDRPPSLEGRRAYLFRYLDGAASDEERLFEPGALKYGRTLITTDSLIWRGVVSDVPKLDDDGLSWKLSISSISDILNASVGSDDEYYVQGIYRPYTAGVGIQAIGWSWGVGAAQKITRHVDGFWFTMDEFIADINTALAEIVAAQDGDRLAIESMTLYEREDHGYYLKVKMVASIAVGYPGFSIAFLDSAIGSKMAYKDSPVWSDADTFSVSAFSANYAAAFGNGQTRYLSLDAGREYYGDDDKTGSLFPSYLNAPQNWINPPCPKDRAVYNYMYFDGPRYITTNTVTTNGIDRIYTEAELLDKLNIGDSVLCKTDRGDLYLPVLSLGSPSPYFVFDATDVYTLVDLFDQTTGERTDKFFLTGSTTLKLSGSSVTGNVVDFVESINDNSYRANTGNYPFFTHADIADLTALRSVIRGDFFNNRRWNVADKTTLKQILMEELKLIGCYLFYTSTGQMDVRQLSVGGPSELDMTDDYICLEGGKRIGWNRNPLGIISTIKITDKYRGIERSWVLRDANLAIYKNKSRGEFSIAPKSEYNAQSQFTPLSDAATFQGFGSIMFSLLGADYEIISIPVIADIMTDCVVGNWITITSAHVINTNTGAYGITNIPALVMGRDWGLDPAKDAVGTVIVMVKSNPNGDYARTGYAPSLRITSASNISGNNWFCLCGGTYYGQLGIDDRAYFAEGYRVAVMKENEATPTIVTGTVTVIYSSPNDFVIIAFDSAAPWGGGIGYGDVYVAELYGDFSTHPEMKQYVWLANDEHRLFTDTENAFEVL